MKHIYFILIFCSLFSTLSSAQLPIEYGQAVMTGITRDVFNPFVNINPDSATMRLFDVRNRPAFSNSNWYAPSYYHPDWTMGTVDGTGVKTDKLSTVFGVTVDKQGYIYVTDFTSLGLGVGGPGQCTGNNYMDGAFPLGAFPKGKGGNGAVYKIDKFTGAVTVLANLPNPAVYPVFDKNNTTCQQYTDPYGRTHFYRGGENPTTGKKVGVGLGNICYDRDHDQLFITNREDGKIYRMSTSGSILSTFDPFNDDDGLAGHSPLGERIWGIGYHNNKIYFGRWVQEFGTATQNEVWSVALNAGTGDFAAANSEIFELSPVWHNNQFGQPYNGKNGGDGSSWVANPITDITFSSEGKMLLSMRTMITDFAERGHTSFTYEYTPTGTGWNLTPREIFTGSYWQNRNAVGGVTYGYSTWDASNQESLLSSREQFTWTTSDAIRVIEPPTGETIYGMQGTSIAGNSMGDPGWYSNSNVVDYNHLSLNSQNAENSKGSMGDVEVFRELCQETPNEICNNGSESLELTAEAGLMNVMWYDSTSNTLIGTGNILIIHGTETFLTDGYESIYYTATDATGCPWELCCLVRVSTKLCAPLPCSVSLTATPGPCVPATNKYTLTGSMTFTNPPATGTLTVQITGGGSQVFTAPFTSPQVYSIVGQTSDGASHTVTATFSADVNCTNSATYTAPANCTPMPCSVSLTVSAGPCDPATNQYVLGGVLDFTNPPATGTLTVQITGGGSQVFNAPFIGQQLYIITGQPSDGANHTVTATFSADNSCTNSATYTAPASCQCTITITPTQPVDCDNAGTFTPTDDKIKFTLNVTSTNGGSGYTISATPGTITPTSGTYGNPTLFSMQAGSVGAGDVTVTVTDNVTGTCKQTAVIIDPEVCDLGGLCLLDAAGLTTLQCHDANTPKTAADDYVSFSLNPTGLGLSSSYLISVVSGGGSVTPSVANYGAATSFQFNAGSASQKYKIIRITDTGNNGCTLDIQIDSPGTCSGCVNPPCVPINVIKN